MKSRPHTPERLDVAQFAHEAATLEGQWTTPELARLSEDLVVASDTAADTVQWSIRGREVLRTGATPRIWLDVSAQAKVHLECQRCLTPVETTLDVSRSFLFVPGGETQAAELDAELEDDVLPLARSLDVRELIEDELIMALPLVPRHDACPVSLPLCDAQPASAPGDDAEVTADERPHPFAALQALKGRLKS